MDDVTWAALTLTLTALGAAWTWYAYRNRGLTSAMRGAALSLLPLAAYLTHTLRMFTRIADAVTDWAVGLVFSPRVWVGVSVAGIAVVLFLVARYLDARGGGAPARAPKAGREKKASAPAVGQPAAGRGKPAIDDDLADIEEMLRKRGIQ